MTNLPPSIIEQAIWMVRELGIDVDKPTAHDYGRLCSNMALLKMNAIPDENFDVNWRKLLENVMYPDDRDYPHDLFLISKDGNSHYILLLKAVDDIYNKYGE